jgi:beta-lactamase class A
MVTLCVLLLAASAASLRGDTANQIAAVESRLGGRIGVAALDSGSGKRVDYRADERFPMCSTFKFLAAAAVLKRVDENKEKLDRFVPYGAKDILEYAPVTKAHLGDGGMALGALCAAAIEQSDNTAGNLLLDANWRAKRSDGFCAQPWRHHDEAGPQRTRIEQCHSRRRT